ncbi:hypothetical protein [Caldivirga maquilingensis]|uniref:Uncharacterized protein n=1 Tax=Caldivirga maquilingensis (strain ATCC 700844 / DSM 13496 / JCM 10307 / IC-167) TaxID=397948 RepID=A8ME64_CALMQ|nr:hypothetical protein [Caldivirga maquilingensis]ABW02070.1 hypothetical protein Cmaq_1243 [Caldivirga maquilingensis IC-167]
MVSVNDFMIGRSLVLGDVEPALTVPSIYVTDDAGNVRVKRAVSETGGDLVLSSYVKLPIRDKAVESSVLNLTGDINNIARLINELIRVSKLSVVIVGWQPDKGWSTTPLFTSELGVIRNKVKALASLYPHDVFELSDRYIYVLYMNHPSG